MTFNLTLVQLAGVTVSREDDLTSCRLYTDLLPWSYTYFTPESSLIDPALRFLGSPLRLRFTHCASTP